MLTLHLRGEDVGDTGYWAWEWSDRGEPEFTTVDRGELDAALQKLDAALPELLPSEAALRETQALTMLRSGPQAPGMAELLRRLGPSGTSGPQERKYREALMIQRCVTGALSGLDSERELMTMLGDLLLPDRLVRTIRERRAEGSVELRVLPAPSCVRVPWELLVTGSTAEPDERLLDLASVVTMAPLLGRDGDSTIPHPSWEAVRSAPSLHVIDARVPAAGPVLSSDAEQRWAEVIDGGSVAEPGIGREWLSDQLQRQRSRFVYVGHVAATESTAGKTAMVLDDPPTLYGLGGRSGAVRYLTAQDLLAGTVGHEQHFRNLSERSMLPVEEAVAKEYDGRPVFLPAARGDGDRPREVPGRELWPMPPRVGLIACHSGADHAHAEPFGLVTALLENGAELVTATRWVLLSDWVFQHVADAEPLDGMAVAVDGMLEAEDPFAELAAWQRTRLAAWRESGELADSPLTWAAVTHHHAPDRTIRDED